jgi:hypothetical protein
VEKIGIGFLMDGSFVFGMKNNTSVFKFGNVDIAFLPDSYVQPSIPCFYSLYTKNEGDCMSETPPYNGLISKFSVI